MSKVVALIDAHFLCHRAWHTTGKLEYGGERVGVLFGLLREIETIQKHFNPVQFVFAFESDVKTKREELFPEYKSSRKNKQYTLEEKLERQKLLEQIQKIRTDYLFNMGFRNVLRFDGYEADDILAQVADNLEEENDKLALIVSADKDLYQCLSNKTSFYNPILKKLITLKSFREEYDIYPFEWSKVKAIAGDKSDDIPGISGVGIKTAVKYVKRELKEGNKKAQAIESDLETYNRNMRLVRLPFDKSLRIQLVEDETTPKQMRLFKDKVGFHF